MNELINVKDENGKKLVSARELYTALGLDTKKFVRWSEKNIRDDEFHDEGVDYLESLKVSRGKELIDYLVTLDFAKELAMMARTSKSKEIRDYFIECEKQLKTIALQSPQAFVDSLVLEKNSINKYLPNFLTWKNVDEVMPRLIDRVTASVESGESKLEVLTATINVTKEMYEACPGSAEKEIVARYINDARDKYDRVLIARGAAREKHNNDLRARIEELEDERYSQQDYFHFINSEIGSDDYRLLSDSLEEYIGFIAKNKFNGDFKQANNFIYKTFKSQTGIDVSKLDKKKLGVGSIREALYALEPAYVNAILKIAVNEAILLGFQF